MIELGLQNPEKYVIKDHVEGEGKVISSDYI